MDTYADMIEFAQNAEDVEVKWKDYQNAKRSFKGQDGHRKGLSQGQARVPPNSFPQKRSGENSAFTPAKRDETQIICTYCKTKGHREKNCWRKFGKCFSCGSSDHQVKDCPIDKISVPKPVAKVPTRMDALDKSDGDGNANTV